VPRRKRRQMVKEALEAVELADKIDSTANNLSGGQKQRLAIARAIVNKPNLIFADEPTGNLDSVTGDTVVGLLFDMNKKLGSTLVVTHNPELTRYADRVVYMHDGAIIRDQKTKVGEIPTLARRAMKVSRSKTEEDDWAGVSALMTALPDKGKVRSRRSSSSNTTRKVQKRRRG